MKRSTTHWESKMQIPDIPNIQRREFGFLFPSRTFQEDKKR
jgi:hypothetical protein